jgi:hypothetical protein
VVLIGFLRAKGPNGPGKGCAAVLPSQQWHVPLAPHDLEGGGVVNTSAALVKEYATLEPSQQDEFRKDLHLVEVDDYVTPLQTILGGLSIWGRDTDHRSEGVRGVFQGSAPNMAALESTATAFAKWWAAAIAGGGVLAGWYTATRASAIDFWAQASTPEKVTAIGSVAAVLIAMAISIAIIVAADVGARSRANSAIYAARAQITDAYLAMWRSAELASVQYHALSGLVRAASASKRTLRLHDDGTTYLVDGFRMHGHEPQVHDGTTGRWVSLSTHADFSID